MPLKTLHKRARKEDGDRMNRTVWWLIPAFLVLGGCAVTYTHPTKSASQFEQDRAACERSARKMLAAKGVT